MAGKHVMQNFPCQAALGGPCFNGKCITVKPQLCSGD